MNQRKFRLRRKHILILVFAFISFTAFFPALFAAEATATAPQAAKTDEKAASSTDQTKASEIKKTSPSLPTVLVSKGSHTKAASKPSSSGAVGPVTEEKVQEPEKGGKIIEIPKKKASDQNVRESDTGLLASKAEPLQKAEIEMVTKTINGEVSAKGPSGIALVYEKNEKKRSSKEMWFPFELDLKLDGYQAVKDIQEGDMVKVTYEEAEDGSKRVLKGIRLEKKKPVEEEKPVDDKEETEKERA